MNTGTLIMLCGLPGSGKTTLAKKLETERNAIRLCPDEWVVALIEDVKNIKEMDRLREPVEQLLWKEAQRLLRLGVTVILENGFWPRQERDLYRDTAKKLGVSVELYFLDVPIETLWERVHKRNNTIEDGAINITHDNLVDWSKLFDAPTKEEGDMYDAYYHLV